MYAVNGFKSTSEESKPGSRHYVPGANRNVIVGASAVKNVVRMFKAAKADGITLQALSSYRRNSHQTELWEPVQDSNYVARPKHSGHQNPRKSAIDIAIGGPIKANAYPARHSDKPVSITNPRVASKSKVYKWLNKNAHKYGYVQYFMEPWHWSYQSSKKSR